MKRRHLFAVVACLAVLAGACAKEQRPETKPMTTAQRDSAIAASKLPGAGVVKKSLEVADSAKARAARNTPR